MNEEYFPIADEDSWILHPGLTMTTAELEEACPGCTGWMHLHRFSEIASRSDVITHIKQWHKEVPDHMLLPISQAVIVENFGR